ncbi:polyphosphate kinase 1 [Flavitalea sp. BT771]|uniref:polyphosphate kinase 1 n=1 Tax=Flavitalea sp. BT771 TaxID=3063329 RepID=UPI0026E2317C|nr:polyphosphate kinase 1 [Flavitalea sp. BT771]MDO6434565.1 polyphosphate kinase 1 [Flavitalea sp. BT771]MDV6223465.1 polyphosphate kinase 1 [Flavitalea sp. BT771]
MAELMKRKTIARDISWLSFNSRVLQEAADPSVPLRERIRFLGIFSNNMDEFFRVRVATLKRMSEYSGRKTRINMHLEVSPDKILGDIQSMVMEQNEEFDTIWSDIRKEMEKEKVFLVSEDHLDQTQQQFIQNYFEEEVRSNIIPLMIESIPQFPYLRDKSIYLGVVLSRQDGSMKRKYALIEVPSRVLGRFVQLPSATMDEHHIILLEDIIRYNLRSIFAYFGYDTYGSWAFKVTRDAEIDIDNDISTTLIQKIEKGLKNRRRGKPVRFVYDKEMDSHLLEYLMKRLNLARKDNLMPGGRIHNFRHFMDFPDVFHKKGQRKKPFTHPLLIKTPRVTDVVLDQDVMLHFPYHSFNPVIDMLREAAIDPNVTTIKITCYRLASNSKIINTLVNAVRNGKHVTVMLELRARFDEEANLEWKERLEDEGVKVLIGIPNIKIHAKICLIKKRINNFTIHYGFVSTGNLNEKTAKVYGDHCLLTSDRHIMADVNRIFNYLEKWKEGTDSLRACKALIPCPTSLRRELIKMITREIRLAKEKKPATMTLKMNSLSDEELIDKLYEAARAGVEIKLIIRGIFCMFSENSKFIIPVKAISIIDEYLEHARVFIFGNNGKEKVYISSADWMVRNLDHRVEATCPVLDPTIRHELIKILDIQLADNVKARWLDNELLNKYKKDNPDVKVRSQIEIYNYLYHKALHGEETKPSEIPQIPPITHATGSY